MTAIHWGIEIVRPAGKIRALVERLIRRRDLEVGLGTAAWTGLVFLIVHFGRLA